MRLKLLILFSVLAIFISFSQIEADEVKQKEVIDNIRANIDAATKVLGDAIENCEKQSKKITYLSWILLI